MSKNPDPNLKLASTKGVTRTLDDWSTMFHLCLVILPPRPEAAVFVPIARRIFNVFGDADCRTAFCVVGNEFIARGVLGEAEDQYLSFCDPDGELVASLGLQHSRYEGPTGIVGVLQDACRQQGLPAASLWAAVPHYVSLAPSPRAARALCDRLGQLIDVPVDTTELAEAEESYVEQVTEAIAGDETGETAEYVANLEKRTDELDLEEHEEDIPSGDTLAAELTRFLRERDAENGDDAPREQ